jgi:molecular chaperone GrpE
MANEENVRRIAKKDIENAKNFGITSFAKSMLDVADNFNRAIDAIPNEKKEELTNGNGDPIFASLLEGIIAVEKGLQKSFNSQGLVRFGDIGDKFDPDMYEALYQQPDADKDEDTVCAILKSGYKLKDRVVRAAQVGTTKKP